MEWQYTGTIILFYSWLIIYFFQFYNQKYCLRFTKVFVQFGSFLKLIMWKIKSEAVPSRSKHFCSPAKTAYSTYLQQSSYLVRNSLIHKLRNCCVQQQTTFKQAFDVREVSCLNVYLFHLFQDMLIRWTLSEQKVLKFWASQMFLILRLFWESRDLEAFAMHLIWLQWKCSKIDENILPYKLFVYVSAYF